MAKKKANGKKDDGGNADLVHDKAARSAYINNYFAERYALDREIEVATEKHVSGIRDQRNTLNKNFRADMDYKEADVKGDYLNYKRRREVELFDDEGERDKVLDNMRELYEATYSEDGQLHWAGGSFGEEKGKGKKKPNFMKGDAANGAGAPA